MDTFVCFHRTTIDFLVQWRATSVTIPVNSTLFLFQLSFIQGPMSLYLACTLTCPNWQGVAHDHWSCAVPANWWESLLLVAPLHYGQWWSNLFRLSPITFRIGTSHEQARFGTKPCLGWNLSIIPSQEEKESTRGSSGKFKCIVTYLFR